MKLSSRPRILERLYTWAGGGRTLEATKSKDVSLPYCHYFLRCPDFISIKVECRETFGCANPVRMGEFQVEDWQRIQKDVEIIPRNSNYHKRNSQDTFGGTWAG